MQGIYDCASRSAKREREREREREGWARQYERKPREERREDGIKKFFGRGDGNLKEMGEES